MIAKTPNIRCFVTYVIYGSSKGDNVTFFTVFYCMASLKRAVSGPFFRGNTYCNLMLDLNVYKQVVIKDGVTA